MNAVAIIKALDVIEDRQPRIFSGFELNELNGLAQPDPFNFCFNFCFCCLDSLKQPSVSHSFVRQMPACYSHYGFLLNIS